MRPQSTVCLATLATLLALLCLPQTVSAAPGDLDTSFSGDGLAVTNLGRGPSTAQATAVQSDGKIVVVGQGGSGRDFAVARYNPDGTLDPSFGGDGRVQTILNCASGSNRDVLIEPDGKIVAAGESCLVRYLTDGSLDNTFSGDGRINLGDLFMSGLARQTDGRILAVGFGAAAGQNQNGDFVIARFNTDGSVDNSFSSDGRATADFGGTDRSTAIAVQGDGKIVAAGSTATGFGMPSHFAIARFTSAGEPDNAFSGDGLTTTDFGSSSNALAVGLRSDGTIVAAGRAGGDVAVARYDSAGAPDDTFSGDGEQTTNVSVGAAGEEARDLVVQADGKVVVAASDFNAANFALVRYTTDGTPDSSFSSDGIQTTDFGGPNDRSEGVALQADGKIVAVGHAGTVSFPDDRGDFAVARYSTDGEPDTAFSGDGRLTTEFDGNDGAAGMAIQSDGKIVAVGHTGAGGLAVARYNSDGSPDTGFGDQGVARADFGSPDGASDVVIQPDGKIIAVGRAGFQGVALARFMSNGSPDTSFSGDGKQTTPAGNMISGAPDADVALQGDGKIVVAGTLSPASGDAQFLLARYTAAGEPDNSFSGDGVATPDVAPGHDRASGVVVQSDGKIVAVGTNAAPGGARFALARYTTSGEPDSSFSGDGFQTSPIGTSAGARGAVLQGDGKIIAVGSSDGAFALARYTTAGEPDTAFSGDGFQTTNVGGSFGASAENAALLADGRIVVVGTRNFAGPALARYTASGEPDSSFGNAGTTTTGLASSANAVAVDSNGRIVAAGSAETTTIDFAVMRFEGGGAPSTPDADGDGVPDSTDNCDNTPGPASNNGCPPDADGDGVPDASDDCPNQAAPGSSNGCPANNQTNNNNQGTGNQNTGTGGSSGGGGTGSGGTTPVNPNVPQPPPAPTAAGGRTASAALRDITAPRNGTAVLEFNFGVAGRLTIEGTANVPGGRARAAARVRVVRISRSVRPGALRLVVRPNSRGAKALRRAKRLRVTLKITYTPQGGKATTTTRTITLRIRR